MLELILETTKDPSPIYKIKRLDYANAGAGDLKIFPNPEEIEICDALYLPFHANSISAIYSKGHDVISGRFTGCIMATCIYYGSRIVCHVSTGADQDCKDEWNRIKSLPEVTDVLEFLPHKHVGSETGIYDCFGIITWDLQAFSIKVEKLGQDGTTRKVTSVKRMTKI